MLTVRPGEVVAVVESGDDGGDDGDDADAKKCKKCFLEEQKENFQFSSGSQQSS